MQSKRGAARRATVRDTESMAVDSSPTYSPDTAVLVFSPLAWLKLQYLCHAGQTEVGGFGVARDEKHPLYIDDFYTVPQEAGWASVEFDDAGVADFAEDRVAEGLKPAQFLRVWIHTHPGDSPHPSSLDEETFRGRFGDCDWAVMFILAKGGDVYARLKFTAASGPVGSMVIAVAVDWARWKGQADVIRDETAAHVGEWVAEYRKNVTTDTWGRRSDHRPIEVRADTTRMIRAEPVFGATDDEDEDEDEDDEESPLEAYLASLGLDFDDLLEARDEDLDYYGFTEADILNLRAGNRLDDMTDEDYRLFRREWEYWDADREQTAEEAEEVEDDDDDAPKQRFRNPKGPVPRRGKYDRRR